MSETTPLEHVRTIMESARVAALTYVDSRDRLVSTPMGAQKFEHPRTTYWITEKDSDKVAALRKDPRVNLTYSSDDGYVSLSGTARLVEDDAKLKELWSVFADAMMDGGPEDPNSGLLEVTADTAEWWSTPNGIVTAVKVLAAKVSGKKQSDLGDSGVIDF